MHHLSIDLETYSSVPLTKAGAQKYIQSPDFQILLFAYRVDGAPVEIMTDVFGADKHTEKMEDYTLAIQLWQDLSADTKRKTEEFFDLLSKVIPENILLSLTYTFPTISASIPIRLTLGPRQSESRLPWFRGTLPPGNSASPPSWGQASAPSHCPWRRSKEDELMGYNVYMTRAGYALQAKLFAEGGDPVITRVEIGSGTLPEDADPGTFTELLERWCTATSTKPVRSGCAVDLTVEYRSDLDGGLKEPFQIREFGVFAAGAEGEEALILYGDLSDYPESAVPQEYGGCVRRFPVHLEVGPNANVSGNPFTMTFESLDGLAISGVWNTAQARVELSGEVLWQQPNWAVKRWAPSSKSRKTAVWWSSMLPNTTMRAG